MTEDTSYFDAFLHFCLMLFCFASDVYMTVDVGGLGLCFCLIGIGIHCL